MKKYRIKIIERNNGEICYIPQVYILNQRTNRPDWFNIVFVINVARLNIPSCSNFLTNVEFDGHKEHCCKNEEDALKMINQMKTQFAHEEGFKVKSQTFKEVL